MVTLKSFEWMARLPSPFEVAVGLLEVPKVLRNQNLLASHVGFRLSQIVALAVKQMAQQEAWVVQSAQPHINRVIDVVVPIMGVNHVLRWQVVAQDVLSAVRVEPEADALTITASPAHVILTVLPSVYDVLHEVRFDSSLSASLDMAAVMEHVHISGHSALAEWVNRLVKHLRPDVWGQLSSVLGATPTSFVQQGFYAAQAKCVEISQVLRTRCLDGDAEHAPVMVRHALLDDFAAQVQATRSAVDTLAGRVAQLRRRAEQGRS